MKRDIELIRTLLLAIEQGDDGSGEGVDLTALLADSDSQGFDKDLLFERVTADDDNTVYGHLLLLDEAGFVEGMESGSLNASYRNYEPRRLTWAGQDFLDSIRDEKVWTKTLQKLATVSGSASFEVVKALAISFMQKELGLSS